MFIIITIVTIFYIYGLKILNDNYKKSYFTVALDDKDKYDLLKSHSKIKILLKCVTIDNKIIVEHEDNNFFEKDNNVEIISKKILILMNIMMNTM